MDDRRQPAEGEGPPLQGPHWHRNLVIEPSPVFVPLRLVLQPGGLAVELTRPDMLVGRHSDADVRLQLPDVSRRHCRFVFTNSRWQVFDLNSLNGLFVNGERVQQAVLRDGDLLQIGGCLFAVDLPLGRPTHTEHGPRSPRQVLGSIADALPQPTADAEPLKKEAS
jgi:predicted component of type VI protein secretion system